jgi:antagonist of KipI
MIHVIDPGILTTIQDAGRWGYQAYGVPVSGVMDAFAFACANKFVGNSPEYAAHEIHSPITLQTSDRHLIALTDDDVILQIDGRTTPMWTSVFVRAGSIIEIKPRRVAGWIYFAVRGGIDVPRVLGSRSTYLRGGFGGLNGRALQAGDVIPIGDSSASDLASLAGRSASDRVRAFANRPPPIRVVLGPHADWFTSEAITTLTTSEFTLTDVADRMGYRLSGAALGRARVGELISCGAPLGAIQVPADGQPIVLMADHQTTGGYPIIATVIRADIPMLAQRAPGERVTFAIVDVETAHTAWREILKVIE